MYTISQFSKLCGLTVKALRYYDTEGLLKPSFRKAENQYRYYSDEDLKTAQMIQYLRSLEFTIMEIKDCLLYTSHFKIMEDSVSQYQGYDAGEIDFATYVANEGYTNYKGKDDLYRVDPYVSNYFIDINSLSTENKALQDVNVRKAMAMAVEMCIRDSLMPDSATREREFAPLLLIRDNYPKYVLSMDELDFSQQGIQHKNIIDFLLAEG